MTERETAGPALRAIGLSVAYGRATVLDGIDLAVADGQFTALLGPNGSGKSTLLRALAGLHRANAGKVLLDGRPVADRSAGDIAKRIGILSQNPVASESLTVRNLVQQGRYPYRKLFGGWSNEDEEACAQALSLTGMEALGERLLDSLSGGQRQRAWIAMALAQKTGILLLDEPTTFLDLAHQIEIMELLAELVRTQGTTVVAVLHDLNQAARHADRIALLREGRLVAEGDPASILTERAIAEVFGVDCRIIEDPVSGKPLCVPIRKTPSASADCGEPVANSQQIRRNGGKPQKHD